MKLNYPKFLDIFLTQFPVLLDSNKNWKDSNATIERVCH
jgi:hypothetical protein